MVLFTRRSVGATPLLRQWQRRSKSARSGRRRQEIAVMPKTLINDVFQVSTESAEKAAKALGIETERLHPAVMSRSKTRSIRSRR
jgi:ABC-type sugar transport system substrate-binding protein